MIAKHEEGFVRWHAMGHVTGADMMSQYTLPPIHMGLKNFVWELRKW